MEDGSRQVEDPCWTDLHEAWKRIIRFKNRSETMIRTEVDEVRDILNKYPEAYAKILDDGDIYDNEELYSKSLYILAYIL